MKKQVPNLIKIEFPYDTKSIDGMLIFKFNRIIEEGYAIATHDFNLYCAIWLRYVDIENISESLKSYIIEDGSIKSQIRFEKIALEIEIGNKISDEDSKFYNLWLIRRASERKKIVNREIGRTGISTKNLNVKNSSYYRQLINLIGNFHDVTLIDWFVPIKLTFEKMAHIYVKHVEETKFGDGAFKKRTYFNYHHDEIFTLLKTILKKEGESIKDHFLKVACGHDTGDVSLIKDYHRGFGKFEPIYFNGDKFSLTINRSGLIEKFHQL